MPPTAGGSAENIGIGVESGGLRRNNADWGPEMKSTQKVRPIRYFSPFLEGFVVRCGDAAGGIGAVGIGIGVFRPKIADPVAKMKSTQNFTPLVTLFARNLRLTLHDGDAAANRRHRRRKRRSRPKSSEK